MNKESSHDSDSSPTGLPHDGDPSSTGSPNGGNSRGQSRFDIRRIWAKLDLDVPSLLAMAKTALPPTIALAIFQADAIASVYSTTGYLLAISSILSGASAPRAIYLETLFINIVAICTTVASSLLGMWSAQQARKHTIPAGEPLTGYNASQSAVCGVWLFFQIYLINSLKAAYPQAKFAGVLSSIITIVALAYGAQFDSMTKSIALASRLLYTFLTGIGIATVVSLCFAPKTCRQIVFDDMAAYLEGMRTTLKCQTTYMQSLETQDMFESNPEAAKLKEAVAKIKAINGKIFADLKPAKREIAIGKLKAEDLSEIRRLIRQVFLPLIGMSFLTDIYERIAVFYSKDEPGSLQPLRPVVSITKAQRIKEWQALMKSLHEPFAKMSFAMDEAMEHTMLVLQLKKKRTKKMASNEKPADLEAGASSTAPGEKGFYVHFEKQIEDFYQSREVTMRAWCERNDISLHPNSFETPYLWPENSDGSASTRSQRQLLTLLYVEFLLWSAARAQLELVRYADAKAADGTLSKLTLILPGRKRVKKFLRTFHTTNGLSEHNPELNEGGSFEFGQSYGARKDPERLPIETRGQAFGAILRKIPDTLRSDSSVFGFRLAVALMCVAVVAYLRSTQQFFVEQRLFWAEIMIAVSMTRTAGLAIFIYTLRLLGSLIGAIFCFAIYYIVDGHVAGSIVFFFIILSSFAYVTVKKPAYGLVVTIAMVTASLIIGYEYQVKKLGIEVATSNGQLYYPIYLLAPYRLATVAAGIFIAFVFTIFPYPISETSVLRKDLGAALYIAGHHYAVVHETAKARIHGDEGDIKDKSSPGHKLLKTRTKLFSQEMLLIAKMRGTSGTIKYQLSFGGRFPKETYDKIITTLENLTNYSSLIGYTSSSFSIEGAPSQSTWVHDFRKLLFESHTTSDRLISTLYMLSFSLLNGQPLPPHLQLPEQDQMLHRLQSIDRDILSIRHISEPGYAAFAVMQIASHSIISDLHELIRLVKLLVGDLDFSYQHIKRDVESAAKETSSLEGQKGKLA